MKLSIIFATYNRNDILRSTLQGMADMDTTDIDWEVILVDNACNKETARIATQFMTSLPLTFLVEDRPGKNSALNTALSHARGDLYLFTDDDIIPDSAWAKSLLAAAERWPDVELFGGRILPKYPQGEKAPPITDKDFLSIAYVIADWDLPEGTHSPVTKIWGPNMMVRRNVFEQGLRFDPAIGPNGSNYVMGSESDFLKRARASGCTELYVPSALVYHQIRPEQLSHKWLFGRAYRLGRTMPYQGRVLPELGIQKWMWRELISQFLNFNISRIFGRESKQLEYGVKYYKIRGHIHQCRKGSRLPAGSQSA